MCHVVRTVTERSDQWQRAKPYGIMRVFRTSVLPFEPADAKRSTKCVAGSHSKGLPFEPADAKRSTKCVAGSHSKGLPFEPADAKRSTKYCLWSCLTDAVRSDAVASRTVRGTVTSKTHFKVRCRLAFQSTTHLHRLNTFIALNTFIVI